MVILPKDVAPSQDASGNEGLVRDSLLKMVHNLGGHCYYEGATPNIYPKKIDSKKNTCDFWEIFGAGSPSRDPATRTIHLRK